MKISSILLLILTSFNLFATDYYCNPNGGNNSNSGTQASPFSNFSSVNWSSKGLSNGDNIYLMNGNHGDAAITSLTFTSYVTVKTLAGQTSASLKSVLLTNSSYWAFDGVKIDGTGNVNPNANPKAGIAYLFRTDLNSNHIKIVNCLIQSADAVESWTKATWYDKVLNGVWLRGHHAIVENNVIQNVYHAFEIGISADDSQVRNNLIDNFAADGIRGLGNRGVYENNVVQNCYINDYGIQHDDAFQCYATGPETAKRANIILRNNKFLLWNKALPSDMDIIGDMMQGIIITDGHADGWIVENNLVVSNQSHGISLYGATNCKVQNNTVVRSPVYSYDSGLEPWISLLDQKKNPDDNTGTWDQRHSNSNNIIRNNVTTKLTTWFFDASSTVEGNIDIDASNIANLRAIFNDYDNNDFYPKTSGTALDAGMNSDLTSLDLAGNPRLIDGDNNGTATVDVGCYEYGVDTTPPTFIADDTDLETEFVIVYNEKVSQATAENTSNYSLNNGVTVQSASLDVDGITLTITTSSMTAGTYTVTVNGVKDINGNSISNVDNDFVFACDLISASSSEAGNPPENSFDDDMGTKWAADGKGESITRRFCSTKTVSSVDIAFGFGDARTYTFELFTSADGVTYVSSGTYTSILTLTKQNFDIPDVSAKFFKIVGDGNKVNNLPNNNWNNYVEIVYNEEADITAPTFTANDTYFSTQLTIIFSETVTQATAEDITNYSFDNGVTAPSAVLDADGVTVVISTSAMSDETYTLTINGVEDLEGNPTVGATDTFTYICDNISASSYQDNGTTEIHPPEHAFDNDLGTRWATLGVGEWIVKSFCDAKTTSSVDIAFAWGDGNIYSFEIEVSNDGITYTNIYTDASSGTSNAKETFTFTKTTARYFKIIAKGNNNNTWNNYSEIEFHTVSAPVPPTVVIIASPSDGYVSDPLIVIDGDEFIDGGGDTQIVRNPEIRNHMKIGNSDVKGDANLTSAIIPFQLPQIPLGHTKLEGAKLVVYVPFGREHANTVIDLYGLEHKPESNNGVISSADYYSGSFVATRGTDTGIQQNMFSKNNPNGYLDISRLEVTINQDELVAYLNDGYVAGEWVFLRLSVNNTATTGAHYFGVDGADGTSMDYFHGSLRPNSEIKPAELHLNFATALTAEITTWNGTAWSNGIPNKLKDAIINGNINVGGASSDIKNIQARNLVVNDGFDVKVFAGSNINVFGNFNVESNATVVIENSGSFVAEVGATLNLDGTFSVVRTANPSTDNYTYWSSPVATTIENSIGVGSSKVYKYETANFDDADSDNIDDDYNDWLSASGSMTTGRGYIAKANSIDAQTITFTAETSDGINIGHLTAPVVLSADTSGDADDDLDDWNLIGNPYSSALLASKFIKANEANMYGTIYFWTHNTAKVDGKYSLDDYASYNLTGGTVTSLPAVSGGPAPTGLIASGQGFFMEATNASDISFNRNMQLLSVVDADNAHFYKKGTVIENVNPVMDRVWFNLCNDNSFSQVLLGFLPEATDGLDNLYDGIRLDAGNDVNLYTLLDDNELVIQGMSDFDVSRVIKLGFNASTSTSLSIGIDRLEGVLLDNETLVLLKDNYNGTTHNLKKFDYEFSVAESGKYNDRFEIVFRTGTLTNNSKLIKEIEVYPNPVVGNSFKINLKGASIDENSIELYDLNGVNIQFKQSLNSGDIEIQLPSNISSGVYVLQVLQGNGYMQKKIIVK